MAFALPKWLAGQSITVRVHPPGGAALIRNYSLSNLPGSRDYRISVKREPHGVVSRYIHDTVSAGDVLDVAAPRGTFFLADGDAPVIFVSAGVGATPVLSMLHALADEGSERTIWWLHGARNGAEHAFADESRDLLNRLTAQSIPGLLQPSREHGPTGGRLRRTGTPLGGGDRPARAAPRRGRLPVRTRGVHDATQCRPRRYGLDPARVHSEIFGAAAALTPGIAATSVPPHLPSGPPGPGPDVQFARSGIGVPWGPPHASLLELAEACDVPTRWSCRTGVCHNCETALLAGTVRYDPEPLEPPADGNILICCSQPDGDVVVDL